MCSSQKKATPHTCECTSEEAVYQLRQLLRRLRLQTDYLGKEEEGGGQAMGPHFGQLRAALRVEGLTSTYFLALSQAPPVLDMETAIWTPETRAPASRPARVRVPNRMPTTTGESMTRQPGGIISDNDACARRDQTSGAILSSEPAAHRLHLRH